MINLSSKYRLAVFNNIEIIARTRLNHNNIGMLMRKDSPLAEKETICAEDLRDKPLIVSRQTSINTEMSH